LNVEKLDAELAEKLALLLRSLSYVSDIPVLSNTFRRVQLSRNTAHYGLLLRICEFVHECLLPEQDGRASKFIDILKDEKKMADIFERFVRNFYRAEQQEYSAEVELIAWDAPAISPMHERYLPQMRTDVSLRSATRTIVLDTKYYPEALSRYMGGEKIRSDHLYQLFAYVKNLERNGGPDATCEGILLYPAVGEQLDLQYMAGAHALRVKTLDLDTDWQEIRAQLLNVIGLQAY